MNRFHMHKHTYTFTQTHTQKTYKINITYEYHAQIRAHHIEKKVAIRIEQIVIPVFEACFHFRYL